jgi:hypothetical protein
MLAVFHASSNQPRNEFHLFSRMLKLASLFAQHNFQLSVTGNQRRSIQKHRERKIVHCNARGNAGSRTLPDREFCPCAQFLGSNLG